jgi:hypothetical protein
MKKIEHKFQCRTYQLQCGSPRVAFHASPILLFLLLFLGGGPNRVLKVAISRKKINKKLEKRI